MDSTENNKVYILHGIPDRDQTEHVLQFFPATHEGLLTLITFKESLPGRYCCSLLSGIDYEKITYEQSIFG